MDNKNIENLLKEVKKPSIDASSHKTNLRRALLNSPLFEKNKSSLFLNSFNKRIKLSLLATLPALLIIVMVLVTTFNTAQVSAKELAQKSHQAVSGLTADEQAILEKKLGINFDIEELLKEAKQAEDLTILSREELLSQYRQASAWLPHEISKELQFLKFIKEKHITTILGISGGNSLPSLVLMLSDDTSAEFSEEHTIKINK